MTRGIERTIANLQTMQPDQTITLWRNAIRMLNDPSKLHRHQDARRLIRAIGLEWDRRRKQGLCAADAFRWPSTDAAGGTGNLQTDDWLREGVFALMGYKVGNTAGEIARFRQGILSEIFSGPIPPFFPQQHLAEWGTPGSILRLKKMAEAIAAFTRNGKRRRDSKMSAAVKDWEADLEFLYQRYYIGKFTFAWPTTEIDL